MTFRLFGPTDPTCKASPVGTRTASVGSSGKATSAGVTTGAVGTYHWTASYTGDANNNAATSACASESVIVTKATAVLAPGSAAATASSTSLSATATVSGFHPTGIVSFVFYDLGNTDCTGKRLSTRRVSLDANSTASSAPVTAPAAGVYAVRLRYVGDANNRSTAATCTRSRCSPRRRSPRRNADHRTCAVGCRAVRTRWPARGRIAASSNV